MLRKDGYARVRIDNKEYDLSEEIILEKNKKHNIDAVIDRLIIRSDIRSRLYEAIEIAAKLSGGKVVIDVVGKEPIIMSEKYACPNCDFNWGGPLFQLTTDLFAGRLNCTSRIDVGYPRKRYQSAGRCQNPE
jgi:excinuclease UvrABC ATPase subunit